MSAVTKQKNPRVLRQDADELAVRAQAIVDKMESEDRGFQGDEKTTFDSLMLTRQELLDRADAQEQLATARGESSGVWVDDSGKAQANEARQQLAQTYERETALIPQTDGPGLPGAADLGHRNDFIDWMLHNDGSGFLLGNLLEPQSVRDRMAENMRQERWTAGEKLQRAFFNAALDVNTVARLTGRQPKDMRALGVGTATAGGYLVDDSMASYVEKAMKQYGGIFRTRAQVIPTMTGAPIDYPTVNDTANEGALIAEGANNTEQDIATGNVILQAYKYTSKTIKVSLELLQDSAFDVESLIFDCFAERIARIVSRHCITGTGTSQPQGLATAATSGIQLTAGSSAITYGNVMALYGSVDPAYDEMAEFAFNKNTMVKLLNVLDGDNRPLFRFDMLADGPAAVFGPGGHKYTLIQELQDQGNGNKFMLYGDFSKYKIRQAMATEIFRKNEVHIDNAQIGFVGFARFDGKFIDAGGGAVKAMTQAT